MSKEKKLNILKSIIVFTIFFNSTLLHYLVAIILGFNINKITTSDSVIISSISNIIMIIIFIFIYKKDLIKEFKIFKKDLNNNLNTGLSWWVVGLTIMIISNLIIGVVFKGGGADNEKSVQALINSLPWLMVINAGFLAPFVEEIVFRKSLKNVISNKKIFVILAFLLFGGAHVYTSATNITDWLYIIPYGALGATFAIAYNKSNTFFTPLLMHVFHNTILVLLSVLK